MTGYGGARGSCEGMELRVELRSVNNRHLDVSVKLPRHILYAEEGLRRLISQHITRGHVDVFVMLETGESVDEIVKVNTPLLDMYAEAIEGIAARYPALETGLSACTLARLPDVMTLQKREVDHDVLESALQAVTSEALEQFDAMRLREGESLRANILEHADAIEKLVGQVELRSPETVTAYRDKLYKKLSELLADRSVDEARVLTEAAIFADKVSVDEETVRLHSHLAQLRDILETGSPCGRKLDFLVQEFNREANTIGSKGTDTAMASLVIEMKSEIEKIREQIQNIE